MSFHVDFSNSEKNSRDLFFVFKVQLDGPSRLEGENGDLRETFFSKPVLTLLC